MTSGPTSASLLPSELWWAMAMDLRQAPGERMMERYYLSEPDAEGCKRVLADLQHENLVPLIAVNLEQIESILQRKEDALVLGRVIRHQSNMPYWLVWLDGGNQVWEQWVQTADGVDAEQLAMEKYPNSDVILRAPYAAFLEAEEQLAALNRENLDLVWLDLRSEPNRFSSLDLLLKRRTIIPSRVLSEQAWVEFRSA